MLISNIYKFDRVCILHWYPETLQNSLTGSGSFLTNSLEFLHRHFSHLWIEVLIFTCILIIFLAIFSSLGLPGLCSTAVVRAVILSLFHILGKKHQIYHSSLRYSCRVLNVLYQVKEVPLFPVQWKYFFFNFKWRWKFGNCFFYIYWVHHKAYLL